MMFWRFRKVLRDRAAGMAFDWRRGHGSALRLLIAGVVSAGFWGGLLAMVKVRRPEAVVFEDDQIDLTVVDLDADQNRWLAELIDRETLFQQRWDVSDSDVVAQLVEETLEAGSPRVYEPTLRGIPMRQVEPEVSDLPGLEAGALPPPDQVESVVFATPPVNWWMEVEVIEGPEGLAPFSFPFPWPDDPSLMSEGDSWAVVLAVDWQGTVVSIDGWWEKADDVRTPLVLERIRERRFGVLPQEGKLRIWRMAARLVNRPIAE